MDVEDAVCPGACHDSERPADTDERSSNAFVIPKRFRHGLSAGYHDEKMEFGDDPVPRIARLLQGEKPMRTQRKQADDNHEGESFY
jgi:hypothetical protein